MAENESTEPNVALAFGMVIGAGMCTSIGAAVAFCVPLENKRFLAVFPATIPAQYQRVLCDSC